jgi:uncharacterized protein (DUF924 family)
LYDLILDSIPAREKRYAGRSAARVFQALRIAANDELEALREGLSQALELLSDYGRLAAISFHSLEDRIVKQSFAAAIRDERVIAVTKGAVRPSPLEIERNSRAASAKLRVVERRGRGDDFDEAERVLRFWLGEDFSPAGCEQRLRLWFRQDHATDNYVRERFGTLVEKANRGELSHWEEKPRGRLALIILLDQFNRNLHRGSPLAFAADPEALRLCLEGLQRGDLPFAPLERAAFGMPLQHCERIEVQNMSVRYFTDLAAEVDDDLKSAFEEFRRAAGEHRDVIARSGRFPNRAR